MDWTNFLKKVPKKDENSQKGLDFCVFGDFFLKSPKSSQNPKTPKTQKIAAKDRHVVLKYGSRQSIRNQHGQGYGPAREI